MSDHRVRSMSKDQDFHHVMTAVLEQKVDSPMHKAFDKAGIDDVGGITSLSEKWIEALKFTDGTTEAPVLTVLPSGYQQLIICFKAFVQDKILQGLKCSPRLAELGHQDRFPRIQGIWIRSWYLNEDATYFSSRNLNWSKCQQESYIPNQTQRPRLWVQKGDQTWSSCLHCIKGQQVVG